MKEAKTTTHPHPPSGGEMLSRLVASSSLGIGGGFSDGGLFFWGVSGEFRASDAMVSVFDLVMVFGILKSSHKQLYETFFHFKRSYHGFSS